MTLPISAVEEILKIARLCDFKSDVMQDLEKALAEGRDIARRQIIRYLSWVYNLIQDQNNRNLQAVNVYIRSSQIIFPYFNAQEKLDFRLYQRVIIAWSAAGEIGKIIEMVRELGSKLAQPDHQHVAITLLNHLRQHNLYDEILYILAIIDEHWAAPIPLAKQVIESALYAANKATHIDDLIQLNKWVDRFIQKTNESDCEIQLIEFINRRVPNIIIKTGYLSAMRVSSFRLIRILDDDSRHLNNLAWMLMMLHRYMCFDGLASVLEEASLRNPGDARIAFVKGQRMHYKGALSIDLINLFSHLNPDSPLYDDAIRWLATILFANEDKEEALSYYKILEERGFVFDSMDDYRRAYIEIKLSESQVQVAAATVAPSKLMSVIESEFSLPMKAMIALVNVNHYHGSYPNPEEILSLSATSLENLSNFLENWKDFDISLCNQIAKELHHTAETSFKHISMLIDTVPYELTEAYGLLDPRRCRAVYQALMEHIRLLALHSLFRNNPLQGAKAIYAILDMANHLSFSLLALERPEEALGSLCLLKQRLSSVGEPFLDYLIEQCSLSMLPDARSLPATPPGSRVTKSIQHELYPFSSWMEHENLKSSLCLASDPPIKGSFEYVRWDGLVHASRHLVPAQEIHAIAVRNLQIRASFLAIGRKGAMLKPHPWHLMMGDFPYQNPHLLNRGRHAAILELPTTEIKVKEPLLVLGNMDANWHKNYYHWMLLILTRIQLARSLGLLNDRRLLLPYELTSWMKSSLDALGIQEDCIRSYRQDETLVLEDALLISPVEYGTHTLIHALRNALFTEAGISSSISSQSGRFLYISRKDVLSRPLINENKVIEIAGHCGFEIVKPEEYSLLDQVRMFASAQGIAGQAGAAFTNLIFAREGIRVLSIQKEVEAYPTFVDISTVLNQSHRWLLGRTDDRFQSGHPLDSPFHIHEDLLERELEWVKAGKSKLL